MKTCNSDRNSYLNIVHLSVSVSIKQKEVTFRS